MYKSSSKNESSRRNAKNRKISSKECGVFIYNVFGDTRTGVDLGFSFDTTALGNSAKTVQGDLLEYLSK